MTDPKPTPESVEAATRGFHGPSYQPESYVGGKLRERMARALTAAYAADPDLIRLTKEERGWLMKRCGGPMQRDDDPGEKFRVWMREQFARRTESGRS